MDVWMYVYQTEPNRTHVSFLLPTSTNPTPPPYKTGLKRPNGLAFSPDFRTLYVANSDGDDPKWIALDIDPRTGLRRDAGQEPRLLASAKAFQRADGSRVGSP